MTTLPQHAQEHELIQRAQAGDETALDCLHQRLQGSLFRQAYAAVHHYQDAQDVVASAWLQVCLHLSQLQTPAAFRAWMRQIVHTEAKQLLRRQAGHHSGREEPQPAFLDFPLERSLFRLDLERALQALPPSEALVIRLFYLEELSVAEIAQHLARPQNTIGSWLHRGRQHLSHLLTERQETMTASTKTPSQEDRVAQSWQLAGSHPEDYTTGLDHSPSLSGSTSAYLRAKARSPRGFATLMQTFRADQYRGRRWRLSGSLRTENVKGWAAMWMRIDSVPPVRMLGFDNMHERLLQGNHEWQQCQIVLEVPVESNAIAFGFLLAGKGAVWCNEFTFEVVGSEVATTGRDNPSFTLPESPTNLDFETSVS